jgi:ABC-type transport system substrate-binding protein
MSTSKNNIYGLSRTALIGVVVVVVIVVVVGVYFAVSYHPKVTPPPTKVTPTVTVVSNTTLTLAPSNSSILTDLTDVASPDCLDPATGFWTMDQPIFNVVYQELVTWNGTDYMHVVPMLATNWTVSPDYKHYIFTLRQGVYFTDGEAF